MAPRRGGPPSAFTTCVHHPVVQCIFNFFRWLPVIFILAVICWAYYAYVVELCFLTVKNVGEKVAYLIPFHCILFLFLWAYYQTVFAEIGAPSNLFRLPTDVHGALEEAPRPSDHRLILDSFLRERDLPVAMRAFDGAVRYCEKCQCIKPDRSHHCSVCGQCVLKFDHHCPWVNTCVNFRNYKFFIQFLGYALVLCLYIFLTDIYYFIWFWAEGLKEEGASKFHIMFLFFVSGMFAISVSTLFFYHLWLSCKNRTTIESFRDPVFTYGPDKNGFNLGWRLNIREVFGDKPKLWFLPVFSARGDGMSFSTPNRLRREAARAREYGTTGSSPPTTPNHINSRGNEDPDTFSSSPNFNGGGGVGENGQSFTNISATENGQNNVLHSFSSPDVNEQHSAITQSQNNRNVSSASDNRHPQQLGLQQHKGSRSSRDFEFAPKSFKNRNYAHNNSQKFPVPLVASPMSTNYEIVRDIPAGGGIGKGAGPPQKDLSFRDRPQNVSPPNIMSPTAPASFISSPSSASAINHTSHGNGISFPMPAFEAESSGLLSPRHKFIEDNYDSDYENNESGLQRHSPDVQPNRFEYVDPHTLHDIPLTRVIAARS